MFNILRKVWYPTVAEKSNVNKGENVILMNIIKSNESFCSSQEHLISGKKKISIKIKLSNDLAANNPIDSFSFMVEQKNFSKNSSNATSELQAKYTNRKFLSAITSPKFHNSLRRRSLTTKMAATIKYKDPELTNRRTRIVASVYLLDHLVEPRRIDLLENMYGGKLAAHRAARIIQRRFRQYLARKSLLDAECRSHQKLSKQNDRDRENEIALNRVSDISLDSIEFKSIYDPDDPFAIQDDEDRKKIYFIGKNLFNRNCNKGIEYLIKHHILESDGSSIVKFFNSKGLSSYAKGEFLSQDNKPLAVAARREFMEKMSFHNCSIESGIRKLFSKIRIPGEAQKILNMLEEFNTVYLSQNIEFKKKIKKEDTVVLVAFAILMVHTSLYNPSASKQDKMTKEQFIKIFKGLNDEEFINESYLSDLYDNVKKKQMKPLSDHTDLVRNIFNHLTGPNLPKDLVQNYRKHICQFNCNEIQNTNKKPNSHAHSRELFLFNDMLLLTKKVRSNTEFHVRHVVQLSGLIIKPFHKEHYAFGLEIIQPGPKQRTIYLDCISSNTRDKLMRDLAIYIEEVRQINILRAEEGLERFGSIREKNT